MLDGKREFILAIGSERFGSPSVGTRSSIEAVSDAERINVLAEHLLTARSLDELLAFAEPAQ